MANYSARVLLCILVLNTFLTAMGRVGQDEEPGVKKKLANGATVAATQNGMRYVIKNGGTRSYNGLNIFDTYHQTSRGNPKWFARIDHATSKYGAHLNANKAITGLKDPHIKLSGLSAHAAGATGQALKVVNKVAPVLMAINVASDIAEVLEQPNSGKVARVVMKKTGTYVGASYGATAGATYGTAIFPGVGTLIGGMIGGALGGIFGEFGGEAAAEVLNVGRH